MPLWHCYYKCQSVCVPLWHSYCKCQSVNNVVIVIQPVIAIQLLAWIAQAIIGYIIHVEKFFFWDIYIQTRPTDACLMCFFPTCCLLYVLYWGSPHLTSLHQMLCLNYISDCTTIQEWQFIYNGFLLGFTLCWLSCWKSLIFSVLWCVFTVCIVLPSKTTVYF